MKHQIYIFILLVSFFSYSQQNDSKYDYGIQLQISEGYSTFGCIGFNGAVNLNLLKNRITVSPYVEYGTYTSNFQTDVREVNFTEWGFGINTFYSIINKRFFKIKAGTGIIISYLNGLKEEWNGWYGEVHLEEEKINEISVGGNLIAGIRIGDKIALEILPIYFSIGLSDKKYSPKVGIDYKF